MFFRKSLKYYFLIIILFSINFIFSQDFKLKYITYQKNASSNIIQFKILIQNKLWEDINLNEFKIQYFFVEEFDEPQIANVQFEDVGTINIISNIIKKDNYNYIEVEFTEQAGILKSHTDSGELTAEIHSESWSNFNQDNDYSFQPDLYDYSYNERIVLLRNDEIVWGMNPEGQTYTQKLRNADYDDDWLFTDGNKIVDANGNIVRLTGINYYGFETQSLIFHGLYSSDLEDSLDTIAYLGFNIIRIPLSIELVKKWKDGNAPIPDSGAITFWKKNSYLVGKSSLEILNYALEYCEKIGLKVMFDMHCVLKDRKRNIWYYGDYTFDDFIDCWEWLADTYKDKDTVIAMDIFNEPHGRIYNNSYSSEGDPAIWNNSTEPNNFKYAAETAANIILEKNPNLLIMVEGIQCFPKDPINNDWILTTYNDKDQYWENWWGGNLRAVEYYPIDLGIHQNKLVYEPHDYGIRVYAQEWFTDYSVDQITEEHMLEKCWYPNWFYIHEGELIKKDYDGNIVDIIQVEKKPLLIGEWGSSMELEKDIKWFHIMANFIKKHDLSYTYWCYNPTSGDTGGIVEDDFITIDFEKYEIVKPTIWLYNDNGISLDHKIKLGNYGINVTEFYENQ